MFLPAPLFCITPQSSRSERNRAVANVIFYRNGLPEQCDRKRATWRLNISTAAGAERGNDRDSGLDNPQQPPGGCRSGYESKRHSDGNSMSKMHISGSALFHLM